MDEVLSVGDYKFKKKCEDRIQAMLANDVTVVLVSHDIDMIKKMCSKVVWLEKGRIKDMGETLEICSKYETVES